MKKNFILLFLTLITFLITLTTINVKAENGVPYKTFTEDSSHWLIQTQDAYIPVAVIDVLKDEKLKNPEDIFILEEKIYIADTGNKRILVVEDNLNLVTSLGSGILNQPTGVFVTKENEETFIFVADYGNKLVYKFDASGNMIQEFGRPQNSPLFGESESFQPNKITVDARGNIYIVDLANLNGIIQLSKQGEFLGYFGQSLVKPSLRTILQFIFYSDEQIQKVYKEPSTNIANLALDHEGLINTVANDINGNIIQRLNISGNNLLPDGTNTGTVFLTRDYNQLVNLVDIFVGPIGNIYVIDNIGFISEYDMEGNLLFVFGGKDDTGMVKGLLNTPTGIASDDSFNLYAIDKVDSKIHVYAPTEFANLVHEAINYYQDGKYIESKEPWEKVLQMNSMFDLAHIGLGNAYYKLEMYDDAIKHFEIANNKLGYSQSYWELRNIWFNNNLLYILLLFLIWILDRICIKGYYFKLIISYIIKPFTYLTKFKLFKEIKYITYLMKNPADVFYGIKRQKKVSIFTATLLYFVLYIEHLFSKIYTGFVFNFTEVERLSLLSEASQILVPLLIFVIANYLVGSINEGEGRLKDVYISTIYSLMPLIIFWPFVTILSQFLTVNETFIFTSTTNILWAWSFINLFVMIKEVHNYSVKETLKIIIITIFTMLMIVAACFIFYILFNQVIDFIFEVLTEVRSNA
jgi:tetratricopeptide (TPR) repeat protein